MYELKEERFSSFQEEFLDEVQQSQGVVWEYKSNAQNNKLKNSNL